MVNQLDAKGVARLEGFGLDIEAWAAKDHHVLAIPSMFLIDKGVVRWAHAAHDYKTRPKGEAVLAAVTEVLSPE